MKNPSAPFFVDKFMINYANLPSLREIGFKNRSSRGIFLGKEVPNPFF